MGLKSFPQQHLVHMFCYCGVPTGTHPIYHTNTAKLHKLFLYHLDGSYSQHCKAHIPWLSIYLSIYNLAYYHFYPVTFDLF